MVLGPDRSRAGAAALAAAAAVLICASARADDAAIPSATTIVGPVASRPKIEIALGMGASIDDAGLHATTAIPSFYATGGFGEGMFGVDVGVFANSAVGRYRSPTIPIDPVDRLGFDGMLVVRPFAESFAGSGRYPVRVLRAMALDLGLGYERDSRITRGPEVVSRFGARVGLHFDVPLTPAGGRSELRLRFTGRRFLGASKPAFPEGDVASDTRAEVFAALAVVF